jgi:hypothetical protein
LRIFRIRLIHMLSGIPLSAVKNTLIHIWKIVIFSVHCSLSEHAKEFSTHRINMEKQFRQLNRIEWKRANNETLCILLLAALILQSFLFLWTFLLHASLLPELMHWRVHSGWRTILKNIYNHWFLPFFRSFPSIYIRFSKISEKTITNKYYRNLKKIVFLLKILTNSKIADK